MAAWHPPDGRPALKSYLNEHCWPGVANIFHMASAPKTSAYTPSTTITARMRIPDDADPRSGMIPITISDITTAWEKYRQAHPDSYCYRWFCELYPGGAGSRMWFFARSTRLVRRVSSTGPERRSQPRSGSTNRSTQMKKLTKFHEHWSQTR